MNNYYHETIDLLLLWVGIWTHVKKRLKCYTLLIFYESWKIIMPETIFTKPVEWEYQYLGQAMKTQAFYCVPQYITVLTHPTHIVYFFLLAKCRNAVLDTWIWINNLFIVFSLRIVFIELCTAIHIFEFEFRITTNLYNNFSKLSESDNLIAIIN